MKNCSEDIGNPEYEKLVTVWFEKEAQKGQTF